MSATASLSLWPPAASANGATVDALFVALLAVSALAAILFYVAILVLVIRYRRGADVDRRHPPETRRALEIGWTVAPLLAFLALYAWAAREYAERYRPPADAMEVLVVAKQWMWKLQHLNGRRELNELHVPVNRAVRLVMTSQDAIHSFFVPAFRLKQDLVPGRYTSLWFRPTAVGEYHLFCAEFCGSGHSHMRGRVIVMPQAEYVAWLEAGETGPSLAQRGFELFRRKGCSGCHAARSSVHAPDLTGLPGRVVALADGRRVVADDAYLRDSMLLPDKDLVAGYEPIMPSFAGQLDETEIYALIAYLRSTGDAAELRR